MRERRLMEAAAVRTLIMSVVLTLAILAATLLQRLDNGMVLYLIAMLIIMISFASAIVASAIHLQRQIKAICESKDIDNTPNPSALRRRFNAYRWVGRRYTTRWKLLGIPLMDVQFSDLEFGEPSTTNRKSAWGWFAFGDNAVGIIFAAGGIARGLVAMGGIAIGGMAFGGLAVGGIGLGGGSIACIAIGGGAIGYDSAGGAAVAWNSAAGGVEIANHFAAGGFAMANDIKLDASNITKQELASTSLLWLLQWYVQNIWYANAIVIGFTLLVCFASLFAYKKVPNPAAN